MTEIINDNVDITLRIDGLPWYVKNAEVELSRVDTPNYVKLQMVPDLDETLPELPQNIDQLIGSDFWLVADNDLYERRETTAPRSTLLFSGNLANISSTGKNFFEGIAYDPSQQPFAPTKEGGGSITNQRVDLGQPEYTYTPKVGPNAGTVLETQTEKADVLVNKALDKIGIPEKDRVINLEDDGIEISGPNGTVTRGYNRNIFFTDTYIPVDEVLQKAGEFCEAQWWFDKLGKFHFGPPEPDIHEVKFITDADAGKVTPPYQSVRVIGSGAASAEGYSRSHMEVEDKIVVEARLALDENGDPVANFGEGVKEPVFDYHSLEVSTDEQARSVASEIVEELSEQQSDGTVTVVGFPEITPMDGIIMPQDNNPQAANYQPNKSMGGAGYNVYKVRHHLNPDEGFITQIHVGSITGVTKTKMSSEQAATAYDVSTDYELRKADPTEYR